MIAAAQFFAPLNAETTRTRSIALAFSFIALTLVPVLLPCLLHSSSVVTRPVHRLQRLQRDVLRQPVFLQLPVQRRLADTQQACRQQLVALQLPDRAQDRLLLELRQRRYSRRSARLQHR